MNKFELTATEIKVLNNAIDNILNCEVERTVIRNIEGKDYMRPEDWFRQYKIESHDIYATCGATKLVFLVEGLDNWVIKVPFLFSYDNAPGRGITLNYCEAEAQIYQAACDCGKEHYFAPCYYYTTKQGIPFYIQQRVECDEELNSDLFFHYCSTSYSKENYEDEDEYYDDVKNDADYMEDEDRLYAIFGCEDGDDLLTFLDVQEVNDIHAGNFGYFKQMPVLIDYSGY